MTFKEWATKRLGPLVMGVNEDEWEKCRDAWEAAQAAKDEES